MLNIVFYFKNNYSLYSSFYIDKILDFSRNEKIKVVFIENQYDLKISLLKSYDAALRFCSWDDLLKDCDPLDFYWLIGDEIKFINFDFSKLESDLHDKNHNVFFVNPVIENHLSINKYQINTNIHENRFEKIYNLIFRSNSSYWIFSGKIVPEIINQFSNGKYYNFCIETDYNIAFSDIKLVSVNFDFYLKYYFDNNHLNSFLTFFLTNKSNLCEITIFKIKKFISLILNFNQKIFFKVFIYNPGLIIKLAPHLGFALTGLIISKNIRRIISVLTYNMKEKFTFFQSIFLNVKYLIKNKISSSTLEINNKDSNIISLTTYKGRINIVYVSLESIWDQSIKPSQVVLVLSSEEFKNEMELPKSLKRLIRRGLIVKFVEGNVKSFKKLVYTYNVSNIITIDDDIIYPKWWYKKMLNAAENNPKTVISYGCKSLVYTEYRTFLPYRSFDFTSSTKSSLLNLPIGAYGVFYPKNSLHPDLIKSELYMNLATNADDIWFKAMSMLNHVKSCQIFDKPPFFCQTLFSQKSALNQDNYYLDKNDIYIWKVFNFYKELISNETYKY